MNAWESPDATYGSEMNEVEVMLFKDAALGWMWFVVSQSRPLWDESVLDVYTTMAKECGDLSSRFRLSEDRMSLRITGFESEDEAWEWSDVVEWLQTVPA